MNEEKRRKTVNYILGYWLVLTLLLTGGLFGYTLGNVHLVRYYNETLNSSYATTIINTPTEEMKILALGIIVIVMWASAMLISIANSKQREKRK